MNILEGKTALITGGNRGIGRAIVETFAREGANIVFTGRGEMSAALAETLKSIGANYEYVCADASSFSEAEKVAHCCIEKFGRIDILVNNAGITHDTLLMRMTENDWDTVISTNLKSCFNYTKAVQSAMLKQRSGSIINISSVVGIGGNAGQCNYAASKAGIIGLTKSVAKEIGSRNIRCNAIAPGFIETDMTHHLSDEMRKSLLSTIALRRLGTPQDIANIALFLASDAAGYITAQVIQCDGGM